MCIIDSLLFCIIAAAETVNRRGQYEKPKKHRAYRSFLNCIKNGKGQGSKDIFKPEKKWKMMYIRSEKLSRAKNWTTHVSKDTCMV
jgi:hypothetical protein